MNNTPADKPVFGKKNPRVCSACILTPLALPASMSFTQTLKTWPSLLHMHLDSVCFASKHIISEGGQLKKNHSRLGCANSNMFSISCKMH